MSDFLKDIIDFVSQHNGVNDKARLSKLVLNEFSLVQDRSVFYGPKFAIRFIASNKQKCSNTTLSLSNLAKFDHLPFLVCVVTPSENFCYLCNSTFLKKISHSSQELRENNIRGSFNASDIFYEFGALQNEPNNFEQLFSIHQSIGFDGNLARLVEATNNISATGKKFTITEQGKALIAEAPSRAEEFIQSHEAAELKRELDERVHQFRQEILLAALIENVNVRGRVIEYLIAGESDLLKSQLVDALQNRSSLPEFKTDNSLGDYTRVFDAFHTETDVKTKIMILHSNPKGYNLDKILAFLSNEKSVFLFYFVGVDPVRIVNTVLVSMFQTRLLQGTIHLRHWAGRNSRGVSMFDGRVVANLIREPAHDIDQVAARAFLDEISAL
jgi:hypothetical protein